MAGSRRIDILAENEDSSLVVIELKVSRGHDRVVGQILNYMAWVKHNLADGNEVSEIIVASEMSEEIKAAASLLPNVELYEYELSLSLKSVDKTMV